MVAAKSSSMPISIPRDPRVIIIGAGAAGLACATKLLEFGLENILILEAENRIGGRIYTQQFGDNFVDLGAQWVHGEIDNVVYEIVRDRDWLETTGEIYQTYECIRSNGELVPTEIVERLKEILRYILENNSEDLALYEGSLGDYLNERFQDVLQKPEFLDIDVNIAMEFFENFKRIESSETSLRVEEVSAKGFHEYWQCPGDYLLNWKDKGYVRFLRLLMGSSDEKLFGDLEQLIRFNCKVDHIQWDHSDRKAIVRCDNGLHEYEADHVVVTVSLGVLKDRVDSMFHPPLPIEKKRAIVGLGYGSVGKIFLEFPTPFWPDNWFGFTLLWLKEDLEELYHTSYEWVEEIFGFYCVNHQPRLLLAWIVGPYVAKVERMPLDQVKFGCMYLLRRFLTKWEIPDPINIQVSQWQTNANFLGAYSFRSVLSEELNVTAMQLSKPLTVTLPENQHNVCPSASTFSEARDLNQEKTEEIVETCSKSLKPILLFAGEATSIHHYSTVHGAVESGYREANRLINYYSKE